MGQYYRVILKREGYPAKSYWPDSGSKLMEHALLQDSFPGYVCQELYNNPARVMWVGDYAHEIEKWYEEAWGDSHLSASPYPQTPLTINRRFIVNHSKKEYLDCDQYLELTAEYGDSIHPLPILTAAGNGRGSGDYCGMNARQAGRWAGDELSIRDQEPVQGYERLEICFTELD